ncbi:MULTISPECIES: hypothetical protein [unclassified Hyphomicrobium]|uniref:hypothetical protein n=1 Tax=unclassified Hyphomicrobium TaxID=2619925 RepID=UPI000213D88E|nr:MULTISPECIES: hypothetical protein [unclassified Hyphomicrobium]CCB66304.1 exported protein of unknown function [Hyphomicrobium sp. MC1]
MADVFSDLLILLLGPLISLAVAWIIAIKALAARDEISQVVAALTQPSGAGAHAKRGSANNEKR